MGSDRGHLGLMHKSIGFWACVVELATVVVVYREESGGGKEMGRSEMQEPTNIHTLAYLGLRLRYKRGRVFMLPSLSFVVLGSSYHVEALVRTVPKHDNRKYTRI